VCFGRVLGKEKALKDEKAFFRADPYFASTRLCKHNTAAPAGTGPTSSALHAFSNSARAKSSDMRLKCSSATFPFGMISPVLYAAVLSLERVANGEKKEVQGLMAQQVGGAPMQCYREVQAVQECEQVSMMQTKEAKKAKEKEEEQQATEEDAVSKEILKQQSSITAQWAQHRHRIIDESNFILNPLPRSHATASHLLLLQGAYTASRERGRG
jgi:hypothetical protein